MNIHMQLHHTAQHETHMIHAPTHLREDANRWMGWSTYINIHTVYAVHTHTDKISLTETACHYSELMAAA